MLCKIVPRERIKGLWLKIFSKKENIKNIHPQLQHLFERNERQQNIHVDWHSNLPQFIEKIEKNSKNIVQ
jgi:hypothetical protein